MQDLILSQILLLWFFISLIILVVWAIMMGDPDASDWSNKVITIICAILGLPVTIVILLVIFVLWYVTRKRKNNGKL